MTILTKSATKKDDKGVLPLFTPQEHSVHQNEGPIIVAERRVNYPCRAVFFLILVALTVLSFGIIGSSIMARFYGQQHMERMHFVCRLPYNSEDMDRQTMFNFGSADEEVQLAKTLDALDWMQELSKHFNEELERDEEQQRALEKFFTEEVDLDPGQHPDDEGVTRIDVPDFKDGRMGRFLHDFKFNQTAIVDSETKRCFLMPLDRATVLPPTSFRDMMTKMVQGKYNLDMDVIQQNMRVVLPALDDLSDVSPRIQSECAPMRVYKLEKFVHGVFRRSAELNTDAKFGAFAGRMVQYDLHNIDDVQKYEAGRQ